MSLLFDTSLERVDHGNATVLQDVSAGAALCWFYPTDFSSDTGNAFIFSKNSLSWGVLIDTFDGTPNFQIARATTFLAMSATAVQLGTHWAINKWLCVAMSWDTAGANTDQKLYSGTMNVPLAEPSAYASQTVGSGLVTTNVGTNFTTGGTAVANSHVRGRVALVMLFNRTKTLADLRALQFNPPDPFDRSDPSRVLYTRYGLLGAGTQLDVSGYGNHGTITGAAMASPVPLPKLWLPRLINYPHISVQVARPVSDTSVGGWTTDQGLTTNEYARISEVTADDTTYVQSSLTPTADPITFALGTLLTPNGGTQTLHYRYAKDSAGMQINLQVDLLQSGVIVQTWTHTDIAATYVEVAQTVTGVTDYTAALSIRFTANQP